MITVKLTQNECAAMTFDDLQNRPVPEPRSVRSGKLWCHYAATAEEWATLADYADGQAEHWESGGTDNPNSLEDGRRCRKAAARMRAAVEVAR
jgi:hypothetical protein